jgi:hypothetical protein
MPHLNLRILAYLAVVLPCFTVADGAAAGVGGISGGALSALAHRSPVQTVQSGECWEQNGPDGPGYYPCGDGGGGGPILSPAIRLHHRHGAQSGRVGASGVPSAHLRGVGASGSGAASVHTSTGIQGGAPAVSPGLAGVHGPGEATGAHVGAPVSPGVVGAQHVGQPVSPSLAGVHAPGSAAIPHISAPASPGVASGAIGAPHIGAPVSPGLAGMRAPGGGAVPHIGAPASPGLAGVHGVGGGGGIGHR